MKFLKCVSLTVVFVLTLFLGCKRDSDLSFERSSEETLSEFGTEIMQLVAPAISCEAATRTSIGIKVCGGASGTPAGFTIQWMKQPDFFANNGEWVDENDPKLCKATFTGAKYNLAANQCIVVNLGQALLEEGVSTNCASPLSCVTKEYVIRAFTNASNGSPRSGFSDGWECNTLPCREEEQGGCTYTQGYWKNHGPEGCASGNNKNEWPVKSLTLGSVSYTDVQLCSIFNRQVAGNGLISLAHQLIAAKLNIAKGANPATIASAIAAADALIGNLVVPPVGSGSLAPSVTSSLTDQLTKYNEGLTGPPHCN